MRSIKAEKLTHESYAPFGTFYAMAEPEGYSLKGELHCFYPDRLTEAWPVRVGFSPITVKKPEKMIITSVEYHTTTPEIIMPLNDDMIIHVAPASAGTPVPELAKAFIVPKNGMLKINTSVWHICPLPVHEEELKALIVLPECTYQNDCTVVDLKPEEQFEITL